MSEDNLTSALYRATRASALMNDELVTGALMQLENDYITAWRATAVRDTDARERLWQAVQVVGKFRDHLRLMIADGRIAQAEIDAMAARDVKAA